MSKEDGTLRTRVDGGRVLVGPKAVQSVLGAVLLHPQQHQRVLLAPQPPLLPGETRSALLQAAQPSALLQEERWTAVCRLVAGPAGTHAFQLVQIKIERPSLYLHNKIYYPTAP